MTTRSSYEDSLLRNSGLAESALVVIGREHRLADPQSLQAMLEAAEKAEVG